MKWKATVLECLKIQSLGTYVPVSWSHKLPDDGSRLQLQPLRFTGMHVPMAMLNVGSSTVLLVDISRLFVPCFSM